jgi:DNA-binding NtrC family response regulator
VVTAGTAAAAVTALTGSLQAFSVVVLDYRLPDRQDLTLLDDVRRTSPDSAVLMMTAFADDGMRAGAHERGVRAVVDKPFLVKSFVSLIESVSS